LYVRSKQSKEHSSKAATATGKRRGKASIQSSLVVGYDDEVPLQGEIVNEDELLLREQQLSMGPMHECEKATNWFGDEIMDEMMFTRM
jgi:hypothetical protein